MPDPTVPPIPHELMGRKIAIVTDEEVSDRLTPSPNAFLWIVDITDEQHPVPVATWRVPHDEPFNRIAGSAHTSRRRPSTAISSW